MTNARSILLATLLTVSGGAQAHAPDLPTMLAEASHEGRFRLPDAAELLQAERLFDAILSGRPDIDIVPLAGALGMHWSEVPANKALRVLHEAPDRHEGRGLFAFHRSVQGGNVLQMPHSFKDLRTREIGLALFDEGAFRAAAWNTVPRSARGVSAQSPADMAHQPASYFSAFTRALARGVQPLRVLQLHGFDATRRKGAAAAIVSNGSRFSDDALRGFARCLERRSGYRSAVFPDEINELGGTRNAQAAIVSRRGGLAFIHLEMDRNLRERLVTDAAARAGLIACLNETGR